MYQHFKKLGKNKNFKIGKQSEVTKMQLHLHKATTKLAENQLIPQELVEAPKCIGNCAQKTIFMYKTHPACSNIKLNNQVKALKNRK